MRKSSVHRITAYTSLREANAQPSEPTARGSVYKNVTLIKSGLGNRRDKNYYPPHVLESAVNSGLFEGLRAFADHPDAVAEEVQPERTVRDLVGIYENATYNPTSKAVQADLRVLRSHKWLSETIDELLESGHGDKIGLSINGRGQTEPRKIRLEEADGEELEVNELQKFVDLRSTDIVTEAGAGGGFQSLLESARRHPIKETSMKTRQALYAALREAGARGDGAAVVTLTEQLEKLDKGGTATKEMGTFDPKRKVAKKTYEADPKAAADEADEAEDAEADEDVEEAEDHEAELEAEVDEVSDEADESADDVEEAEDDEDEDDEEVEEAEDVEESAAAPPLVRAARRQREFAEATIRGATGTPTGSVKSGGGSFTKNSKFKKKGSKLPQGHKTMSGRRTTGGAMREAEVEILREQNRRLKEALGTRQSADRAKKLLRESNIPAPLRPHLVRSLIGMTDAEMRREIARQEDYVETVAASVRESLVDENYDEIDGVPSSLRESHFGGSRRDDEGSVTTILESVGLPSKKRS